MSSTLFAYLLIFGALGLPRLGAADAGLGATLAALVALAVHVILARWIAPVPGFLSARPSRSGIRRILRIGLPVGLQQPLVDVGTAVHHAIVGLLGIGEVAAMNVVLNMMVLFAVEASIVASPWHAGLWNGGAINQSVRPIISTDKQQP